MKRRLDRIIDTRVIAGAASIGDRTGLPVEEIEGRPAVSIAEGVDVVLTPGDDLRPNNQFNVWIYSGEGSGGSAHIEVNLKSRTEGLPADDNYKSGVRTKINWTGWKKCVFPYENFHIYGCPEGWVHVDTVVVVVSRNRNRIHTEQNDPATGVIAVGSVELEHRERVVGPRLTDEGLFDELDFARPGLEKVRTAATTGDWDCAKRELLAYFETRVEPWHPFDASAALDPDFDTIRADRICDNFVLNQQLPAEFDWAINPIGYLEWMHQLNRHMWFKTLLQAYSKTGNEKYAVKLDDLLDTWMDQNAEPVDHNGGGDPAWETLSTSTRPRSSWLNIWYGLQASPSLRAETRINMLKSLWAHAEHLLEHEGYRNNWFIVESETLALLGVLFPEFTRSKIWRSRGYERLAEAMAEQVWEDGAQSEISAGYHAMSGSGFELPYQLAIHNDLPVDPLIADRLEKMYEYTAWTVRPDFSHPSLNDSGGVSGGRADWAARGGEIFDRDDLTWVGTSGREGQRPDVISHAFDDAGIYVMRSDWGPNAKYLIFDGGPYSAAHQHEDKLSFEIAVGPDPLIVDPGISSYMSEPWTHYYKHARAHNTVLIDGGGQNRRSTQSRAEWIRSVRGENAVGMGATLDYVVSRYNGSYEGVDPDDNLTHERAIILVRNDYWLVLDRVTGNGKHDVEALFHFMPVRVKVDKGRVRTDRENLRNIELAPLNFGISLRPKLITGQNDPVQGWIANRENMPAPCAVYRKPKTELPVEFGWVVAPYASGRSAGLTIRKAKADAGQAFSLTWGDGRRDILFWRWQADGPASFDSFETDARGAVARFDGRKFLGASAIDGTYLRGRGLDRSRAKRGLVE